jgi:hypothetical protein
MAVFKRFRPSHRPRQPDPGDCHELSNVGDNPALWDELDDDALRQVLAIKLLEYGATQESKRIDGLFALYRHVMTRIPPSGRLEMLTEFATLIERHHGFGHMGLLMFIAADTDPGIRSSAALNLAVLYDPADGDMRGGPRFVMTHWETHLVVPAAFSASANQP